MLTYVCARDHLADVYTSVLDVGCMVQSVEYDHTASIEASVLSSTPFLYVSQVVNMGIDSMNECYILFHIC